MVFNFFSSKASYFPKSGGRFYRRGAAGVTWKRIADLVMELYRRPFDYPLTEKATSRFTPGETACFRNSFLCKKQKNYSSKNVQTTF